MDIMSNSEQSPAWVEEGRALTVEEAARYCGISASYMNKMRVSGEGPAFEKAGRMVRYTRAALDAWREHRRFTSTSQYSGGAHAPA